MVYNSNMFVDHPNFIIKDIFTEEEILQIYDLIKQNENNENASTVVGVLGQKAFFVPFPNNITNKITEIMQKHVPYKINLTEYSFARYNNTNGYKPKLFPHRDEMFQSPRITLDIQLNGNFSWPLFVEGKKFILENNQGLVFSGTNQIHWRNKQDLIDGQNLDMIFCHFSSSEYPEVLNKEKLDENQVYWYNKIQITHDEIKIN